MDPCPPVVKIADQVLKIIPGMVFLVSQSMASFVAQKIAKKSALSKCLDHAIFGLMPSLRRGLKNTSYTHLPAKAARGTLA
jgi:hypothetical protein